MVALIFLEHMYNFINYNKMKRKLTILLFLMAGLLSSLSAQRPKVVLSEKEGWYKIGERKVNFTTDRDDIAILGKDRFSAILFKVKDSPIHLVSATVVYESGDNESLELDFPIASAGESQVINLKGGQRAIKKITLVYKTVANRNDERADIEIWGQKIGSKK